MKKKKFTIEYPLKKGSVNILWSSISSPLGLAEWFADVVSVNNNEYTFCWEKHEQTAFLLDIKPTKSIRFQWEEDTETCHYFEMEIHLPEVSGEPALVVTDFAEPSEKDDLILLWNKQIDDLRRKTGI